MTTQSLQESIKITLRFLKQVCWQLKVKGILSKDHFVGMLAFLRVFADDYHHENEQNVMVSTVMADEIPKEDPVITTLHEYAIGRNYLRDMSKAFAAYMTGDRSSSQGVIQNAQAYISLMNGYIEKERKASSVDRLSR
ncbi:MAG TPA: hypothetical protein VMT62_13425 [Syntrophorhabdaceae bacterium]|nr:hypothetical protein [Syntrophorhabdaceae bacterium]